MRFLDASFDVRKWKTNNPDLQNYFNKKENQFSPASEIQGNDKVKVLGIVWDTKSDHLVFFFQSLIESINNIIPTKQNILYISVLSWLVFIRPFKKSVNLLRRLDSKK